MFLIVRVQENIIQINLCTGIFVQVTCYLVGSLPRHRWQHCGDIWGSSWWTSFSLLQLACGPPPIPGVFFFIAFLKNGLYHRLLYMLLDSLFHISGALTAKLYLRMSSLALSTVMFHGSAEERVVAPVVL